MFFAHSRKLNLLSSEFSLALFFFRIIKEFFRVCVLTNVMFSRFFVPAPFEAARLSYHTVSLLSRTFLFVFFEALLLALLPAAFASLFRAAVFAAVVRIIYAFLITVKHFFHFFYFIFFAAYSYYISLSVSLYLVYLG